MYAGRIVGRVVATQKYPTLEGMKLLLVQPTDLSGNDQGDILIAIDAVGTGAGEWIYYVDSKDSAFAFDEELLPIDASIIGIIDKSDLIEIERAWHEKREPK